MLTLEHFLTREGLVDLLSVATYGNYWPDGTKGPHCTDSSFLCPGSCEECAANGVGCWVAGKGDTILFEAH